MATDWDEVRKMRMSKERPDDWPEGVQGISMKGLERPTLLGWERIGHNPQAWDVGTKVAGGSGAVYTGDVLR